MLRSELPRDRRLRLREWRCGPDRRQRPWHARGGHRRRQRRGAHGRRTRGALPRLQGARRLRRWDRIGRDRGDRPLARPGRQPAHPRCRGRHQPEPREPWQRRRPALAGSGPSGSGRRRVRGRGGELGRLPHDQLARLRAARDHRRRGHVAGSDRPVLLARPGRPRRRDQARCPGARSRHRLHLAVGRHPRALRHVDGHATRIGRGGAPARAPSGLDARDRQVGPHELRGRPRRRSLPAGRRPNRRAGRGDRRSHDPAREPELRARPHGRPGVGRDRNPHRAQRLDRSASGLALGRLEPSARDMVQGFAGERLAGTGRDEGRGGDSVAGSCPFRPGRTARLCGRAARERRRSHAARAVRGAPDSAARAPRRRRGSGHRPRSLELQRLALREWTGVHASLRSRRHLRRDGGPWLPVSGGARRESSSPTARA